jgi:hypothetical protein
VGSHLASLLGMSPTAARFALPMKTKPIVASALLVVLASCTLRNYSFPPRHGELPDVPAMEAARQAKAAPGSAGSLRDVFCIPLVALHVEAYKGSDGNWPRGTTYEDTDTYGPLVMIYEMESCHYDEQQKLFERNFDSQYFWGLYQSERNDVRVASGWRVDKESRLLFGLLRWAHKSYHSSLPYDRHNGDG